METHQERKKRLNATAFGILYCLIQYVNIYISVHELIYQQRVGYFCWIMVIQLIDKIVSFSALRRDKFGYEIISLDLFNLGFISVFLKRYPPLYKPMYGAKLFILVIPTVIIQVIFFFALDMIDTVTNRLIQVLMFISYIGYQVIQVRCFFALRLSSQKSTLELLQIGCIYYLNVFSNYGIWLVFASHRDQFFNISLLFYGAILFICMLGFQSYNLFKIKSSQLFLNFLYNTFTSTNYTTEYSFYFHYYSDQFIEFFKERQNDLQIMTIYKIFQLLIYLTLGDVKHFEDKYYYVSKVSNCMVIITFLDVLSNLIQYIFGVRRTFHTVSGTRLNNVRDIASHILSLPRYKKYIYIDNFSPTSSFQPQTENGLYMISFYSEDNSYLQENLISTIYMNENNYKNSSNVTESQSNTNKLNNYNQSFCHSATLPKIKYHMAKKFLEHLFDIQMKGGCILVEQPKLCVSRSKFEVSSYVTYSQISLFFATSKDLPYHTKDIQADWESIFMIHLLENGIGKHKRKADKTYKYCVGLYYQIFLPICILNKYFTPYIPQTPSALISDLFLI